MNDRQTIVEMLRYRRPTGSRTERTFIGEYLRPLGLSQDKAGNLYRRIGDSPVLWSCHTDTVHSKGGRQSVRLIDGIATTTAAGSNCLGADCTAGVWLMAEMIRANRPGLYVFHRAEEIGGIGSSFIADKTPDLLAQSSVAIAFDRRGTGSIITHQAGGRCCSDAFAYSLGNALGMGHAPDAGGTFTDTANYMHLIRECSNLSVGYHNEHKAKESLDTGYLIDLRDALLSLDGRDLIVEREAGSEFDQAPRGGSMYRLVQDHPEEIADFLEEYGFTREELVDLILKRGGVVRR